MIHNLIMVQCVLIQHHAQELNRNEEESLFQSGRGRHWTWQV